MVAHVLPRGQRVVERDGPPQVLLPELAVAVGVVGRVGLRPAQVVADQVRHVLGPKPALRGDRDDPVQHAQQEVLHVALHLEEPVALEPAERAEEDVAVKSEPSSTGDSPRVTWTLPAIRFHRVLKKCLV